MARKARPHQVPAKPREIPAQEEVQEPPTPTLSDAPAYFLVHLRTVHTTHNDSLLSGQRRRFALPHGRKPKPATFSGVRHLIFIILFLGNCRILVRDWRQFGWLSVLQRLGIPLSDFYHALGISVSTLCFWPIALLIELAAVPQARRARQAVSADKKRILKRRWTTILVPHLLNSLLSLCWGSYLVYEHIYHPLIGTVVSCQVTISFMKLVSFFLTNRDLRDAYINGIPVDPLYSPLPYPENLSVSPVVDYFMVPTLVYQPVYPRVDTIRWRVALSLAGEIMLGSMALWLLSFQIAAPVLEHCLEHFQMGDMQGMLDDFLSLTTINIIMWLCLFLLIFQSMLNFAAELTRFADREFYADWWNAGSLGAYWRDWNRPVSNYFRRHVYVPLRKQGWSLVSAQVVVFFFSAVGHELIVGLATKNFNGVAFLCMMGQVPLIMATNPLEKMRGPGTTIGNCVFWISILFGQPTGIIIYYLAWQIRHGT